MSLTSYRTAPPRVTTSVAGRACVSHAGLAAACMHGSACMRLAASVSMLGCLTAPGKPCAAGFPGGAWACMGMPARRTDRPAQSESLRVGCAQPAKSATDLPHRRCRTELPVPRRRPYTSFLPVVNPPLRISCRQPYVARAAGGNVAMLPSTARAAAPRPARGPLLSRARQGAVPRPA